MNLTEKAEILFAIADKIRDDSELHDNGQQPEKRLEAVINRLGGLSDFALDFKKEISPKKKKAASRKKKS